MVITLTLVLLVVAMILFLLGGFNVAASVDWHNLGLAMVVAAAIAHLF